MSSSKQHSDQFYTELLDQYIQGDISPSDLHLLEKRALDDPFLSDALEGYYYADHQLSRKHLKFLQQSTPTKQSLIKRLPIWKMSAVAASLLFVISIGFLLKDSHSSLSKSNDLSAVSSNDNQSAPLAKTESAPISSAEESFSNTSARSNNARENLNTRASAPINIEEKREPFDVSQKKSKTFVENKNQELEITKESSNEVAEVELETQQDQIDSGTQFEMESPVQEMEDEVMAMDDSDSAEPEVIKIRGQSTSQGYIVDGVKIKESKAKNSEGFSKDKVSNSLEGIITDADGLALIGANVMAFNNGNLISTSITNIDGKYTMDSLEVSDLDLEVTYVGYPDARLSDIKLNSGVNTQDVTMDEAQVLNEVVVTELYLEKNMDSYAEPIIGYDAFRAYIQEEGDVLKSKTTSLDYVVLSFRILSDGSLDQIKVLDSNNQDREEEAIQLLRDGGRWKVNKPKNAPYSATYRVEF